MILGSIKFASSVAQWEEEEKKLLAASRNNHHGNNNNNGNGGDRNGGGGDGGRKDGDRGGFIEDRGFDGSPRAALRGDDMGHGEILVREGVNPAFVSLG